MDENSHNVAVTGIIIKDGKYLITQRALTKKNFPGKWTVPGGNLELKDYINRQRDTSVHWYNVLEEVLRREVKEEVGLEIKNIGYVTNLTFIQPDSSPVLIVSLFAEHAEGEVVLDNESINHKWISAEEAKDYDLIEGIHEEIIMLDNLIKGNKIESWKKDLK